MPDHLMNVYNRAPLAFQRGEGAWLITASGERYLDCVSGVACNALGHCHPKLVSALQQQSAQLWHVSNMFQIEGQSNLAERLTDLSFADQVFFANSGAEAVECALKVARRYQAHRGCEERVNIVGFTSAFHGRTHATLSAAGAGTYLEGLGPNLPGYVQVSTDDATGTLSAIKNARTAAVIIEPVQGEGGARAVPPPFLEMVRRECSANGVLLIFDEVQTGMGRTGKLFAHQWSDTCAPDIMALAKGLGGGFPIGACLATQEASSGMAPGSHGSTFGGNPLAAAVALAVIGEVADESFLAHVRDVSASLREGLSELQDAYPDVISEVRGQGLLVGLKLVPNNRNFMAAAREQRLLIGGGGENCVRLLPPLNLKFEEAGELLKRLEATCMQFSEVSHHA